MIKALTLLIVIIFIFPVCSGAEEAETKSKAEEPIIKKLPDPMEDQGYIYEPGGRRDPFLPLVQTKQVKKSIKKAPRVLGTLESYDIPDFKLIAVINKGRGKSVALLLASDNKTFTVKEGTVIGLYKGRVKKIYPDRVIVEEKIKDYKGVLLPRQVVLELYEGGVE
jgi:type IV pilus assembly protein PilP